MRRVLKRVFQRSETKADVPGADDAEVNDTDANSSYSIDSDSSTTLRTSRPKAPGTQPPDIFKSAAEVAGAPTATPPAIYQAIQAVPVPQPMAAPTPVMADPSQQATPSLQIPPRDHVAPKSYESVTIAVGRNCPQGLRRAVWHVTDFDLRKLMYNGAISMVYHAVDKRSGITVALKLYKRIKLNEIERHQVAREIRLHSDLAHDSIIALYAAWKDKAYVYLALEWAPGGDVYSYLKSQRGRLAEELAVPLILEPFMAGLAVIHEKGLIHRDIKPENMLLTNSFQVKIADFGLSIDSKQEIANTRLGTIDYLAPEILDCPVKQHPEDHKDRPDTGYTNKVDCWSVGVLAYELLVGQPPFAAPTAQETLRLIRTKRVEYPSWLSPESVNFMSIVLVRDPTLRPAIAELLDHPWIAKYSRREGGGLARARNRLQQRRPTVDGGMLVRSMTQGDLAQPQLSQKHPHPLQQQHQSQQQLQQQHPQLATMSSQMQSGLPAGGAILPAVDTGAAAANGGGGGALPHPKQVLHHSSTYTHGHTFVHSSPLTPLQGAAAGVDGAAAAAAATLR
ncbi:hypothetical protein PLESTB_001543600 [Pleodorina starrii]|uniref:Protein kinase domain-containing protein n=1 Tax=Pleodorina starrii TaxID=330485 RepID=A0A9W6BY17_9CHLO|nr:hypothetical protein PLESTB_001543600 [Pleodorina starrii]